METSSPGTSSEFGLRFWVVAALLLALAVVVAVAGLTHGVPAARARTLLAALMLASAGHALVRTVRAGRLRERAGAHFLARVRAHGGGAYGAAALGTWLLLQAGALRSDWAAAPGPREFLERLSWEWFLGFGTDSLLHGAQAAFWPVTLLGRYGLALTLAVGALGWMADRLTRGWQPRAADSPGEGAGAAHDPVPEPAA
ncbi:MAG TPA: hypothetical protein VF615_26730 [Longimicrobiaceae bacterium]|jgi:hypothetical protein